MSAGRNQVFPGLRNPAEDSTIPTATSLLAGRPQKTSIKRHKHYKVIEHDSTGVKPC